MYRQIIAATFGVALATSVVAHEMTPTYPKWEVSHMNNVVKTTMSMFNRRQDVEWYEIGLFDKEWKPIPFVTSYRVLKLKYLGHVTFDIYVNKNDMDRAEYVCSKSKLRGEGTKTMLSTRICSRFK